jgi:hypothetical protein
MRSSYTLRMLWVSALLNSSPKCDEYDERQMRTVHAIALNLSVGFTVAYCVSNTCLMRSISIVLCPTEAASLMAVQHLHAGPRTI